MLSMAGGTALFDAVAISGTEASVRAGRGGAASRADACGGGCGPTVCAADCNRRGCAGCAQRGGNGGVVRMGNGAVTFIGGTISRTKAESEAVSAPIPCGVGDVACKLFRCNVLQGMLRVAACRWRAQCGAGKLPCVLFV